MGTVETEIKCESMKIEPQKEHQWLQEMVGEWTFEGSMTMELDKPAESFKGTESVRSLDGIWIVAEGQGDMAGCPGTTIMTLGYDLQKRRYVGTFIATMMTHLWLYEGSLDAGESALTLETEGPDMTAEGKMAKFRDVIEFESHDHRTLTSYLLGDDGNWREFVKAHYWRRR